jgi:hypothetical protein
MKITISSGISAVLPTGPYENLRPSFSANVEIEVGEKETYQDLVKNGQRQLYDICEGMVREVEQKAIVERIRRERENFHWIEIDGKQAPSVTSIISWDEDFGGITPDELRQYASQGNIMHAQGVHFIKTGLWVAPKDLDDCWTDIVILKKGQLNLALEGWSFPSFLEKFPIKDMQISKTSFNRTHFYGGTPDFTGIPVGWNKIKGYEEVKEVPTLFDWKRTCHAVKNGKQLSAYKNMEGYEGIEQACVVELNDKTLRGWSSPEFYGPERIDGFFKMFLSDRNSFKKRYGV